MKKKTMIALALALGISSTAFAGPFADVPAKHWSYDAVNKLAAAGIVDGYGDGTYRGERTITRYEMAQMVAKAMERSDKADAEQKALINKLSVEYADELDNLGVRVSTLEKKIGNITWSGQVRYWYENVSENVSADKNDQATRLLLFMNAPLTDDLTFKGRIWAESSWGQGVNGTTGADASLDQAYIQGKNFTLGRQGIMLGKGLTYAFFPNNDGLTYTIGGDKLKLTAAAFKGTDYGLASGARPNVIAADVAYKASDNLDLTLVYAKNDKDDDFIGEAIDTWSAGFGYTGIKNVGLTFEYGKNESERAENLTSGGADAWIGQIKYKGANWTKPNTWGVWAGYRDAENGFFGRNGDYVWETPVKFASLSPAGYVMEDVKGADYGIEYTVFNNAVATVQYFDFEKDSTGADHKGGTVQLRYFF